MLQHFQRKPKFPLEHERVLDTLYYTPEVSRDTCPHSRGMLSFPPQVKKSPNFRFSSRDKGQLPTSPAKECRCPHHTSRGDWYLLDTGVECGCFVKILKPRISPSTRDQA